MVPNAEENGILDHDVGVVPKSSTSLDDPGRSGRGYCRGEVSERAQTTSVPEAEVWPPPDEPPPSSLLSTPSSSRLSSISALAIRLS